MEQNSKSTPFNLSNKIALPAGNLKTAIIFNIDNDPRFNNPFSELRNVENIALYEKYISHKKKKYLLTILAGKKIISNEDETRGWTRREVIQKLRKIQGLSKYLTTVKRHALNNRAGIIFNILDLDNFGTDLSPFNDFNKEVFDLYPQAKMNINNKAISPGIIRMTQIENNERVPLYIATLFKFSSTSRYKIFDKTNFKRLVKKFKKMNTPNHIPIFVQENFGCDNLNSQQWDQYKQFLNQFLPQTIICTG